MGLKEACEQSARMVAADVQETGCVREAYAELNCVQYQIIAAMVEENGEAWLLKINRYLSDRPWPCLWRFDPDVDMPLQFNCDFVLPCYDQELVDLVRERHDAPYEGTARDAQRVSWIFERAKRLGGKVLCWT
jgi:hypothetical protein